MLKKLFKTKQWTPLVHYCYDGTNYIVFFRKKKNGLMSFKTKQITNSFHIVHFNTELINIEEQWKKLFD